MVKTLAGVGMILVFVAVMTLQYVMTCKNLSQKTIGKINGITLSLVAVSMGALSYLFFIK